MTEGTEKEKADNLLDGTCADYGLFYIQIQAADGSLLDTDLLKEGDLYIQIPKTYSGHKVQILKSAGGTDTLYLETASGTVTTLEGTTYYQVSTSELGYWVMADTYSFETWGANLTAGTYQVQAVMYHMLYDTTSMANVALETPVTLRVEDDGTKTVYFNMGAVQFTDSEGYMANMWSYGDDLEYTDGYPSGTMYNMFVTAYQTDDNGSYLKWSHSLYTFAKTLFFELPDDNPIVPVTVRVPMMDITGSGGYADCRFCLDYSTATAVTLDGELPTVKDAIAATCALVEAAEASEFTSNSWNAIQTALNMAQNLYNSDSATESELKEAYWALKDAIDEVETVKALDLDEGLYTATASVYGGDDTLEVSAKVRRSESGYRVVLTTDSLTGLSVWDTEAGEYKECVKTADTEAGTVSFDVSLSDLMTENLIYYQTGDDSDAQAGYLSFSGLTAQTVDTSELGAAIEEAQAIVREAAEDSDKYDAESVSALETVLAAAVVTYADEMSLQTEVDEQTEALAAAINEVQLGTNLEALATALAEAAELNEDDYTPSSWAVLAEQMDTAQALVDAAEAGETVDATEAAQLVTLLNAAKEALLVKGDKTELQSQYDDAVTIPDEGQACYDILQTVLASTKEVLEDEDAVQSTVDGQLVTLQLAIINLYGGMDKTVLENMVAEIEGLVEDGSLDGYTGESLALLTAALASAQAVLDDGGASQTEVDRQVELLESAYYALVGETEEGAAYVGTYTINGYMKHASKDEDSMGNAALVKPMTIQVTDNGDGTADVRLYMDFVSLTIGTQSGYLAKLYYYPDWTDENTEPDDSATKVSATVESVYEDVWDYYNDPDTGADASVRGTEYPSTMSIPLTWGDDQVWVQVYVPIMEEISGWTGGGYQNAVLILDWDSLTQTAGAASTDEGTLSAKEELETAVAEAQEVLQTAGTSSTKTAALAAAITAGQAAAENMNISQTTVEAVTKAVTKAAAVFSDSAMETDMSSLTAAIAAAEETLADTDVTYTASSREYLELLIAYAETVAASSETTAGQASAWTSALTLATENLVVQCDRTELGKALEAAATYLDAKEYYTAADLEVLQTVYDAALAVYEDADATQEAANAQVSVLNYVVGSLKRVDEEEVDKDGLLSTMIAAASLAGREDLYTAESLAVLVAALETAQEVYTSEDATQAEVNAQVWALNDAILNLKGNTTSGSSSGDDSSGSGSSSDTLDYTNLSDGVYYVTGQMVKINKTTLSMANEAIDHTVKLTVSGGTYYVTLDFNGLTYSGQYGYLKSLQYYLTGYGLDKYGNPTGDTASAEILSYQTDSSGSRVTDNYGTDYPDEVRFPLIAEAISDGYAPLQVFVPVMEAISAGTGTQDVYLYLDWSSLTTTSSGSTSGTDSGSGSSTDDGSGSSSGDTGTTTTALKKGDTLADSSGNTYTVTSAAKKTIAYTGPKNKKVTSVTVPKTVEKNGVTYTVTSIAASALKGCTKLTSLKIASTVTKIGSRAFYGCTKLASVTLPSGVTSIGNRAFAKCTALTKIKIPSGVTKIRTRTFYGCTKLKTVTLSSSLTSIASYAFYKCTALTKITIPSKVTSIGARAFYGCTKLKTVTLSSSLTTIGSRAFCRCTALTKITIPSKVSKIGSYAFYGCKKLKTITVKTKKLTTSRVGNKAFKGIYSKAVIKVPSGKLATYKKLFKARGVGSRATFKKA